MKFFHRLRFRTQIILCFSLVICFVAAATFGSEGVPSQPGAEILHRDVHL